jgi:replicative DNA helicase
MTALSRIDEVFESALRIPPHSDEAEQAVLGGVMLAPERFADVQDVLTASDFYRRDHALIWQAIAELVEKDQPIDAVTVGEWFASQGQIEQVAGGSYLIELASTTPSAANVVAYAEIVQEKARLRQAIDIGTNIVNGAFGRGKSAEDILGEAQLALLHATPSKVTGPRVYRDVLRTWYDHLAEKAAGTRKKAMPTPWGDVNKHIHGLEDGQVYILAARSNMGKSVAGFQVARFSALRGERTMLYSMEMNSDQVANRDIAAIGTVPHEWLLDPEKGSDDYWTRVTNAYRDLQAIDLHIDDSPQLNSRQIIARTKRAHLQKPVRLVVVDHLHEMSLPGKQGEVIERPQALRDLKGLAKDLRCPVFVLAQLNRGAAAPTNGLVARPTMTSLRGSGGIEEVADVVLFLHRPDYYDPNDRPGLVEVIVGKGRDIKTGEVIPLRNRFDVMRLDDWEGDLPKPPAAKKEDNGFEYKPQGNRRAPPNYPRRPYSQGIDE